jgi:NitT/TauT family transport system substrate-binding protein
VGRVGAAAVSLVLVVAAAISAAHADTTSQLQKITVAMTYFPNVQFAPYYVAVSRGYYRKAGLAVQFEYGTSPDFLKLTARGSIDFVNVGGDEVLSAGARGYRLRYVMTQYSRFPAALFSLRSEGIRTVTGLRGHSIGVPLLFGANYVGLLALLDRNRVSHSEVSIKAIGFTQVPSVAHHQIDAAVGYAMNEPVQLREEGYAVQEFDVYHWANIAGAGLATSDSLIARRPGVVRSFVQATLRGLADTLRDPSSAYAISARAVKITLNDRVNRAVLQRCLPFWQAEPGHVLGWIDPSIWQHTALWLRRYAQISRPIQASQFFTNRFVARTSQNAFGG